MLNNLLIAVMTTQYDEVLEDAQNFVIYNQVEATYDLVHRGRLRFVFTFLIPFFMPFCTHILMESRDGIQNNMTYLG